MERHAAHVRNGTSVHALEPSRWPQLLPTPSKSTPSEAVRLPSSYQPSVHTCRINMVYGAP